MSADQSSATVTAAGSSTRRTSRRGCCFAACRRGLAGSKWAQECQHCQTESQTAAAVLAAAHQECQTSASVRKAHLTAVCLAAAAVAVADAVVVRHLCCCCRRRTLLDWRRNCQIHCLRMASMTGVAAAAAAAVAAVAAWPRSSRRRTWLLHYVLTSMRSGRLLGTGCWRRRCEVPKESSSERRLAI